MPMNNRGYRDLRRYAVFAAILLAACVVRRTLAGGAAASTLSERLKSEPLKIAWEAYTNGNSEIWVMNADGSEKVNLTQTPTENEHYPQVSPDGSTIAYTVDTG